MPAPANVPVHGARRAGGAHRAWVTLSVMSRSVLVLGAGMVGTCTALHLQQRGFDVTLIDRRDPGQETSFGNAGLIQAESVEPYAFPMGLGFLAQAALGLRADVQWRADAVLAQAGALWAYHRNSAPERHARLTQAYARLIRQALAEHSPLIEAAGAQDLVRREGFRFVFRTARAWQEGAERARRLERDFGVRHAVLDGAELARAEPALRLPAAGAVHWLEPWAVNDPGELVARYARLFASRGGHLVQADVRSLSSQGAGWSAQTEAGRIEAAQAVMCLGPWADDAIRALGYRFPLFIKRGYHQHFAQPTCLNLPMLDAEVGYCVLPTRIGVRLTTGAEFALIGAPPSRVQLERTARSARELIGLGEPLPAAPWWGSRPCTADMLPVMGPAPRHPGLWFNFGHSHQGFTLGPVAGRHIADLIEGRPPVADPQPYLPARFQ